jgi:hypothetical protein
MDDSIYILIVEVIGLPATVTIAYLGLNDGFLSLISVYRRARNYDACASPFASIPFLFFHSFFTSRLLFILFG